MNNSYFRNHKQGDTFNGAKIIFKRGADAIDLTDAVIIMQFKPNANSVSRFEFSTKNGTITTPRAKDGEMIMMPKIINEIAGTYYFDVQISFPNGVVKTYFSGEFNITADVTR
jgi:hypothetical protein